MAKDCKHEQTFLRSKDGIPVFRVCAFCREELPLIKESKKKSFRFSEENNKDEEV